MYKPESIVENETHKNARDLRYKHITYSRNCNRIWSLGNVRTNEDHPEYSIIKIGQNLRRFLETWGNFLSLKLDYHLTLVWKLLKDYYYYLIIIIRRRRHEWKLCKKLKFDHTNKKHMHKPMTEWRMTDTMSYGILTSKRIT